MSHFVQTKCESCEGGIEYDAEALDNEESRQIECPHCQQLTSISYKVIPPILEPVEKEVDSRAKAIELVYKTMHEQARNAFFGHGVTQDMAAAYTWYYALFTMQQITGVPFALSSTDQHELEQIADIAISGLRDHQIKSAHVQSKEIIAALFTPQDEEASSEDANLRRAIPAEVRREVWRRDQGSCVKCGSREKLEFDHIVPVSKGGSNTARNIELLCESCNRAKSDTIQ